jgi:hypothetical protein
VTEWYQSNADCRTQPQVEMVEIKDSLSRKSFQYSKYLNYTLKYILFFILYQKFLFVLFYTEFGFVLPP